MSEAWTTDVWDAINNDTSSPAVIIGLWEVYRAAQERNNAEAGNNNNNFPNIEDIENLAPRSIMEDVDSMVSRFLNTPEISGISVGWIDQTLGIDFDDYSSEIPRWNETSMKAELGISDLLIVTQSSSNISLRAWLKIRYGLLNKLRYDWGAVSIAGERKRLDRSSATPWLSVEAFFNAASWSTSISYRPLTYLGRDSGFTKRKEAQRGIVKLTKAIYTGAERSGVLYMRADRKIAPLYEPIGPFVVELDYKQIKTYASTSGDFIADPETDGFWSNSQLQTLSDPTGLWPNYYGATVGEWDTRDSFVLQDWGVTDGFNYRDY